MDNLLFISSRIQRCAGAWFVCASLPRPYKYMTSEQNFLCELILLMGVRSSMSSLHDPQIHIYFYSVQKDLSPTAIMEAFDECSSSSAFIRRIFDTTLWCSMHKTMHIRYLNHIYGQTFPSWKITPSIVKISVECYYQCRQGPDHYFERLFSRRLIRK
jgi:hypothetical protein